MEFQRLIIIVIVSSIETKWKYFLFYRSFNELSRRFIFLSRCLLCWHRLFRYPSDVTFHHINWTSIVWLYLSLLVWRIRFLSRYIHTVPQWLINKYVFFLLFFYSNRIERSISFVLFFELFFFNSIRFDRTRIEIDIILSYRCW